MTGVAAHISSKSDSEGDGSQSSSRQWSIPAWRLYARDDQSRLLPPVRVVDVSLRLSICAQAVQIDLHPSQETHIPVVETMIAARPAHNPY